MDAQLERGFLRIYQEVSDPDALFVNEKFRLLRDSRREPQYIVGLTKDVTERRRAGRSGDAGYRSFDEHQISSACSVVNGARLGAICFLPNVLSNIGGD